LARSTSAREMAPVTPAEVDAELAARTAPQPPTAPSPGVRVDPDD
jgi:hypothetical protein